MLNYKGELNEKQYEIVKDIEGTSLVIAGAGTGKTKTLTMRVARIIESGVSPENILTLTFTTKAAKEMKDRISKLGLNINGITVCTYHAFSAMILRKYSKYVGLKTNFTVVDSPEPIIERIVKSRGYKGKTRKEMLKSSEIYSLVSNELMKGVNIDNNIIKYYYGYKNKSYEIKDIIEEFKQYKLDHNLADYNDLLLLCNNLFINNPFIAEELANKYKYVMVDEFQDSNNIQCQILKNLINNVHNNIMVVGDDMQSIYKFNGANYQNILNFPKIFPNCKLYILEKNYRSTSGILSLANAVIADAPYKYDKNLYSDSMDMSPPILKSCYDTNEEVDFVFNQIIKWKNLRFELKEIAVLSRTSSALNLLESKLVKYNIPYQKYGGIKLFEKAHIKDFLSVLKIISNEEDEMAWLRVLTLLKGLGDSAAEKITKMILQNGYMGLIDKSFQKKSYYDKLVTICNCLIRVTDINKNYTLEDQLELVYRNIIPILLEDAYPEDFESRLIDCDKIIEMSKEYTDITTFLEDIYLNGTSAHTKDKDGAIILSTIHSAKGLEFENVIILDCVEGSFPSRLSIATKDNEDIEEERRLLYVAITRAKLNLILMKPIKQYSFGQLYAEPVSRFLDTKRVGFWLNKS